MKDYWRRERQWRAGVKIKGGVEEDVEIIIKVITRGHKVNLIREDR